MANNDYSKYEAYDLLMDPSFKAWALNNGDDKAAQQYWEEVMRLYPHKRELILQTRQMVRQLGNPRPVDANRRQALWQQISDEMEDDATTQHQSPKLRFLPYLKYAAAVIMAASAAVILWPTPKAANVQLATLSGQSQTVLLPDSSEVQLGGNSTISYSNQTAQTHTREVWVTGDANFKVRHLNHDPQHIKQHERFIVHLANHIDVEVLGTVFSVTDRNGKAVVNLQSGSVKITSRQKKQLLKPGERAVYTVGQPLELKQQPATAPLRQWQSNTLLMEKSSITDILPILEGNYGLHISISSKDVLDKQLDGVLPLNDEHRALLILSSIIGTHISRNQNNITLLAN